MKYFSVILTTVFLFISLQAHQVFSDIVTLKNKNIRMEVIDYRNYPEDIIFWIHHAKDTPVISQKLINNGIYPLAVTIYNESNKPIKIIKNAIGGISFAQDHMVAQLYQQDVFARVAKQVALTAVTALGGMELINSWLFVCGKMKYKVPYAAGCFAGIMSLSDSAANNAFIDQAFKSHMLPEESIIDAGCSMRFILFATHTPSGYTLKTLIFDEHDNQVALFTVSLEG